MRVYKYIFTLIAFSLCVYSINAEKRITVDANGGGDFTNLQEAINSVRAFDPAGSTIISVKNGIYYEKIIIPEYVCNVVIIGEDKNKTIISNNDHAKKNNMGTFHTYTMQIRGNDITIENLTIENNAEKVAQAVALHTEGDRIILNNIKLMGNQDTFYAAGENRKVYVANCYIEGTTDFIFGGATVWFENCQIYCKANSYITAASTPQNVKYGFIFDRCKITLANDVNSVYLGRPWRAYAMTIFMNCELPDKINPKGWHNWNNPENEKTARYFEYNNTGEGSDTINRVKWIKILTKEEDKEITENNILGNFINNISTKSIN